MLLTYLMLFVALCLSAVAAFYSIVGLTAIFAAAVLPIVIMGSILEVAKLTVTVWLHENWTQARWSMKAYLCASVVLLMIITSMGIFGFLSKAHSDQSLVGGDVQAKIAVYDEKIRTEKENIDVNRKALKQMDEAVDQVMGRSQDEKGADKAVAVRRAQQKERARLLADIAEAQKKITVLNEQRAPIAAEVRKVEAEVGPIKYIAAFVYGDDPDTNVLEKAVRWVIVMLVIVFDPLAVMMLLASTESMKWSRARKQTQEPVYEPDNGVLTDDQIDQVKQNVNDLEVTDEEEEAFKSLEPKPSDATLAPCYMCGTPLINAAGIGPICPNKQCDIMDNTQNDEIEWSHISSTADKSLLEQHPYLNKPFVHFENLKPMVETTLDDHDHDYDDDHRIKAAQRLWKLDNPEKTMKEQRNLLSFKQIDYLPWLDYLDQVDLIDVPFGTDFPADPIKGDMFVRVDANPTVLYKHNGVKWIQVDKNISDRYTYNQEYIDYLVSKIGSGEYDPDLLNNSERAQIELRLRQDLKE
jgi:hypothetical protein